ncbi:hypothetical protein QAD02_012531 [Eretmocerus hayati]|uniref:Uncharacterized protein n=1 Tax=Eretmocerus hayati TaxID=131215 RepID=A0ACC2P2I9_9HYME|nr:hypothetical protein QAD02_012531 [Eretmocerus hayati]
MISSQSVSNLINDGKLPENTDVAHIYSLPIISLEADSNIDAARVLNPLSGICYCPGLLEHEVPLNDVPMEDVNIMAMETDEPFNLQSVQSSENNIIHHDELDQPLETSREDILGSISIVS